MVINAINLCCYSSFQTPTVGPLELYSLQISQVVILKCLSLWFICHSLIIYQSRFEFKHADTLETICWGSRVSLTRLSVQEGWSEEIAMRPSTRLSSIRNRARSSSGFLRETLINPRAGIFRMHGSETEGVVILWCLQGATQMRKTEDCWITTPYFTQHLQESTWSRDPCSFDLVLLKKHDLLPCSKFRFGHSLATKWISALLFQRALQMSAQSERPRLKNSYELTGLKQAPSFQRTTK